ncbi:MAG: hypothetical protein FD187_1930 [bacterium]|nr:MAG: hypothetical protein FD142_1678 [bacterium]KAF0148507.1 MAG: hypothetical protein FD187_1930 [bacterium]KAF0168051.1 MAG: hypothetical protein FD158_1778 [bacterium]TXT21204.1 MAG: hypothetical protein FD132_714 [bacterium]
MSNPNNRIVPRVALLFLFASIFNSATATPLVTPVKAGNGMTLTTTLDSIMKSEGILLERVSDSKDEFWPLAGDGTVSTVLARARYSASNHYFGGLPGADSGLFGFPALVGSLGGHGIVGDNGVERFVPVLSEDFRLAIRWPQGKMLSLLESDNADFVDHMVTWVAAQDSNHYFVAVDDSKFRHGDADFSDIVLALRKVVGGPLSTPEPETLALTALGLVGFGYIRRRKGTGLWHVGIGNRAWLNTLIQGAAYVHNYFKKLLSRIFTGRSNVQSHVVEVQMQVRLPDASSCTSWVAKSRYVGAVPLNQ